MEQKNDRNYLVSSFLNLHEMMNNLKKKVTFKSYVFSKLVTAKDVVS